MDDGSKNLVKLHLGCQNKYLPGYINIDLPPGDHPVAKVKADMYADIREIDYEPDSIEEVRSHHLLEHFSRPEALMLLSRWHSWLKTGGLLVVETPDFEESAKKFIASDLDSQFLLGRHIFGSHEAEWAYHRDFWSENKFRHVLAALDYGDFRFEKFSSNLERKIPLLAKVPMGKDEIIKKLRPLGLHNLPSIICYARKTVSDIDYRAAVTEILKKSIIGGEEKMLEIWLRGIEGKI